MTTTTTTTTDLPAPESIRVSRVPLGTPCQVHDMGAEGLAEFILSSLMRRGADGVVVCRACFGRASRHHEERMASARAARDRRAWQWPAGTAVRRWPRRWRAGVFEGEPVLTRTRSESWHCADIRQEVVLVEGELGGVDVRCLERVQIR